MLAAGVTGLAIDALAFLAREAACGHLVETLWQRGRHWRTRPPSARPCPTPPATAPITSTFPLREPK